MPNDHDYIPKIPHTTGTKAVADVLHECARQDEKFGAQRNQSFDRWTTILTEEVGEFAQEALSCPDYPRPGNPLPENLRKEAVQVAAVAIQIIEDIDSRAAQEFSIKPGAPWIAERHRGLDVLGKLGEGWRLVNRGEKLESGDEYLSELNRWMPSCAHKSHSVLKTGNIPVAGEYPIQRSTYRRRIATRCVFKRVPYPKFYNCDYSSFALPSSYKESEERIIKELSERLRVQKDIEARAQLIAAGREYEIPYVASRDLGRTKDEDGWRILREGEIVQEGDQVLGYYFQSWIDCLESVGAIVGKRGTHPTCTYRREVEPPKPVYRELDLFDVIRESDEWTYDLLNLQDSFGWKPVSYLGGCIQVGRTVDEAAAAWHQTRYYGKTNVFKGRVRRKVA